MQLSIVIVNYNTRDNLHAALTALAGQTSSMDAELCVVDNASTDGSADMVARDFPSVTLLQNPHNVGFARANNQAFERTAGELVLLMNPDVIPGDAAIQCLHDYLSSHPEIALVGPKLVFPDGRPQASVFEFPRVHRDLFLDRLPGATRRLMQARCPTQACEVEWVLGAVLMVRCTVLQDMDGFRNAFFLYGEEKDLQLRMHRAGHQKCFLPDAVFVHDKGAATRQMPAESRLRLYRGMDLFMQLNYPPPCAGATVLPTSPAQPYAAEPPAQAGR